MACRLASLIRRTKRWMLPMSRRRFDTLFRYILPGRERAPEGVWGFGEPAKSDLTILRLLGCFDSADGWD